MLKSSRHDGCTEPQPGTASSKRQRSAPSQGLFEGGLAGTADKLAVANQQMQLRQVVDRYRNCSLSM
jgi:hypothetical protein